MHQDRKQQAAGPQSQPDGDEGGKRRQGHGERVEGEVAVRETECVRHAEQKAGQESAPAPIDAEEARAASERAIKGVEQDAAVAWFLFQPRHGELERDVLAARRVARESQRDRGEERAVERHHG